MGEEAARVERERAMRRTRRDSIAGDGRGVGGGNGKGEGLRGIVEVD